MAAEVTVDSPDFGHLEPVVDAAERELEQIGVTELPEVVVADAGYWHQGQMENIVCRGVKVLIPPGSRKRKGARLGWGGGPYAFMRRVLQTDAGRELYRKRQAMIEPVFGHTSSTGGSTASSDEEEPPAARNGGYSPPPTTSSSSTSTSSRPRPPKSQPPRSATPSPPSAIALNARPTPRTPTPLRNSLA